MLETENTGRKRGRSPLSLFYQVRQISIAAQAMDEEKARACQVAKIIERDRMTTHRKLYDLEKDGRVTKVVIKGLLKWKEAQP